MHSQFVCIDREGACSPLSTDADGWVDIEWEAVEVHVILGLHVLSCRIISSPLGQWLRLI